MATAIKPDLRFIEELRAVGGSDVKKCYQCATCSVACPLAPPDHPFPRKEMVWAQWGLKDKLEGNIDIWLCHNCGTCSDMCPRGAKPADLLAALRNMTYRKLLIPQLGDWLSSPKYLPILIGIPAALLLVVWMIVSAVRGQPMIPSGPIVYGKIFPGDFTIDPIFTATFLSMVYCFYLGVRKMWKSFETLPKTMEIAPAGPRPNLLNSVKEVILEEIATHAKFNDCGNNEVRFKGHLVLMYAFVALAIVTGVIAGAHWGGYIAPKFLEGVFGFFGHTPLPIYNPIKLLALAGAGAMIYGLVKLTGRRLELDAKVHKSSWYDWYLLGLIWAVGITGILSLLFRWLDAPGIAYPTYYVHLVSVWMMFAYLPWTKLGHLVYRTTALVYARHTGRLPLPKSEEKVFMV